MDQRAIRRQLEEHRRELEDELAALTAVPRDAMAAVSFGKRIGDGTVEAVERLTTTSAARSLTQKAREVERALAKLGEGTYGTCDVCGGAVPAERLEAVPWAVRCVGCASRGAEQR